MCCGTGATKAELQAELERPGLFRTIFYEAGIGIALGGLDGQLLTCNPALLRMLGYSVEERDALTIGQISHPEDIAADAALFRDLLDGQRQQYQLKKRYLHKDGHVVWGWLIVSLVRDAKGRPQFAIGMVEDITAQEEAEEARRAADEQLKQTQEQLVQAAKLSAIGELSASIAHELNNPLTNILGYADLLLRECAPDDLRRKDLEVIASEARRTQAIARSLLGLARPARNVRAPTDVNELLRQPLGVLRAHLESSGIHVTESYATNLGPVYADEGQLQQVFFNLITNASEAMLEGGTLSLQTAIVDGEAAVAVTDTGSGISTENLAHVFEPFFSTKATGTGLGLAISRGIVQEHGGRITVESKEGQGTTFTVWLPRGAGDKIGDAE